MEPTWTLRARYSRKDPLSPGYLVPGAADSMRWFAWKEQHGVADQQLGSSRWPTSSELGHRLDSMENPLEPREADRLEHRFGLVSGRWYQVTYGVVSENGRMQLCILDVRSEEDESKEAHER